MEALSSNISTSSRGLRWGVVFLVALLLIFLYNGPICVLGVVEQRELNFGKNGEFKILQVADMHYSNGKITPCLNVLPSQMPYCSDLNTSAFINRMIQAENPDFIVFTGDNIFGFDSKDSATSLNEAFATAIASNIPWAAILGNHDQEGSLPREGVMKHIVGMKNTLSQFNPESHVIDGFGNYNLEVNGVKGTGFENKSVLNLYFLDSGDYSTVPIIPGYGWIKPSQQLWFQRTSEKLQKAYMSKPAAQKRPAPGLVYFHIPLPEFASFDSSNFTGVRQEGISSASVNSGFFSTMLSAGDVKAVFTGHDHVNDFCGELNGIHLCYAGGFGYHAYGMTGWSRRARVVVASLEKTEKGGWSGVKTIKTWKRLDDLHLTPIDAQVLYSKGSTGFYLFYVLQAAAILAVFFCMCTQKETGWWNLSHAYSNFDASQPVPSVLALGYVKCMFLELSDEADQVQTKRRMPILLKIVGKYTIYRQDGNVLIQNYFLQ